MQICTDYGFGGFDGHGDADVVAAWDLLYEADPRHVE